MTAEQTLTPIEAVALEEACRIADRLDKLDDILRGESKEWMRLRIPAGGDGTTVRVVLTSALSEARQQAVAYTQIVDKLTKAKPVEKPEREASGSDDLAARRAARRQAAGL